MKEYTCIVCPNGCHLTYDEKTDVVTGNKCPRGVEYARSEFHHPVRSVCSTIKTTVKGYPVISVRTKGDIDKDKIFDLMKEINKIVITDYLTIGTVVMKNALNSGVDVITTTDMVKGN